MEYEDEITHTWTAVAVYECNRAYGGPEEGGWYFDCGELETSIPPIIVSPPTEEAIRQAIATQEDYIRGMNLNEGRYEPNSVLCNGYYEVVTFDGCLPKAFPKNRPHYE